MVAEAVPWLQNFHVQNQTILLRDSCLYPSGYHVSSSLLFNRGGKKWNDFRKYGQLRRGTKINHRSRLPKIQCYDVFNLLSYESASRVLGYEKQWIFCEEMEPNWEDSKHFLTCLEADVISGWGGGWRLCRFIVWSVHTGDSLLSDCVLNGGVSRLPSWKRQRKMVAITGFKVLGGESFFANPSPNILFLYREIIWTDVTGVRESDWCFHPSNKENS